MCRRNSMLERREMLLLRVSLKGREENFPRRSVRVRLSKKIEIPNAVNVRQLLLIICSLVCALSS